MSRLAHFKTLEETQRLEHEKTLESLYRDRSSIETYIKTLNKELGISKLKKLPNDKTHYQS
jgi:hypothetical protein